MARKRFSPEQIITMLREAEVLLNQSSPIGEVCRKLRISEQTYYVWSYDMAMERTSDGRPLRILAVIDEYTRECLSLHGARRIRSGDVLDQLNELFITRRMSEYIRSDNVLSLESSSFSG